MAEHLVFGEEGESLAKEYLLQQGYTVLEERWRFSHAEVDLIARQNNELIIVEVKARSTKYFGYPEESVSTKKQQKLAEAAEAYLREHGLSCPIRFDIVSIVKTGNEKPEIHHIEDAFFPVDDGEMES